MEKRLQELQVLKNKTPQPKNLPSHIQKLYEFEPDLKNPNFWKLLAIQTGFSLSETDDSLLFSRFPVYGRSAKTGLWPAARKLCEHEEAHLEELNRLYQNIEVEAPPVTEGICREPWEDPELLEDGWKYWEPRLPVGARLNKAEE